MWNRLFKKKKSSSSTTTKKSTSKLFDSVFLSSCSSGKDADKIDNEKNNSINHKLDSQQQKSNSKNNSKKKSDDPDDFLPPENETLEMCQICKRKFNQSTLVKHEQICEKMAIKKRKPFDSSSQRRAGTDLANYMPECVAPTNTIHNHYSNKINSPDSIGGVGGGGCVGGGAGLGKHISPMKMDGAIRRRASEPTKLAAIGTTPTSSRSQLHYYNNNHHQYNNTTATDSTSPSITRAMKRQMAPVSEQCPHCYRSFGIKAYDRHVEWCKEKAKLNQMHHGSPMLTSAAKERLEARTKYKAPTLKNKRETNREKYSGYNCGDSNYSYSEFGSEDGRSKSNSEEREHRKLSMSISMNSSLSSHQGDTKYDPFMSARRQMEELFLPQPTITNFPSSSSSTTNNNNFKRNTGGGSSNSIMSTSLTSNSSNPFINNGKKSSSQQQQTINTINTTKPSPFTFRRTASLRVPKKSPKPLILPARKPTTIQRGISIDGPVSTNFMKPEEYDELPVKSHAIITPDLVPNKLKSPSRSQSRDRSIERPLRYGDSQNSPIKRSPISRSQSRDRSTERSAGTSNINSPTFTRLPSKIPSSNFMITKTDSLSTFLKYENDLNEPNSMYKTDNNFDVGKFNPMSPSSPSPPPLPALPKLSLLTASTSVGLSSASSQQPQPPPPPQSPITKSSPQQFSRYLTEKELKDKSNSLNRQTQLFEKHSTKPEQKLNNFDLPQKSTPSLPLPPSEPEQCLVPAPAEFSTDNSFIDPILINLCDNLSISESANLMNESSSSASSSSPAPASPLPSKSAPIPGSFIDETNNNRPINSINKNTIEPLRVVMKEPIVLKPIVLANNSSSSSGSSRFGIIGSKVGTVSTGNDGHSSNSADICGSQCDQDNQRYSFEKRNHNQNQRRQLILNKENNFQLNNDSTIKSPIAATTNTTELDNPQKYESNHQRKPIAKDTNIETLFNDFDFEEFISSFDDEEKYPIFKGYKDILSNRSNNTNSNNNNNNKYPTNVEQSNIEPAPSPSSSAVSSASTSASTSPANLSLENRTESNIDEIISKNDENNKFELNDTDDDCSIMDFSNGSEKEKSIFEYEKNDKKTSQRIDGYIFNDSKLLPSTRIKNVVTTKTISRTIPFSAAPSTQQTRKSLSPVVVVGGQTVPSSATSNNKNKRLFDDLRLIETPLQILEKNDASSPITPQTPKYSNNFSNLFNNINNHNNNNNNNTSIFTTIPKSNVDSAYNSLSTNSPQSEAPVPPVRRYITRASRNTSNSPQDFQGLHLSGLSSTYHSHKPHNSPILSSAITNNNDNINNSNNNNNNNSHKSYSSPAYSSSESDSSSFPPINLKQDIFNYQHQQQQTHQQTQQQQSKQLPQQQLQPQAHQTNHLLKSKSAVTNTTTAIQTNSNNQTLSKFCHSCGSRFTISTAKFCMDCGSRRVALT